jgi:hypothetical protein
MSQQDREKREMWVARIKDWQQSGLSQADYCRRNKLQDHRLTYWKKRILPKQPPVSFIPLVLPGQRPCNYRGIRITTPNGFTIETDSEIEAGALKQLIAGVAAL